MLNIGDTFTLVGEEPCDDTDHYQVIKEGNDYLFAWNDYTHRMIKLDTNTDAVRAPKYIIESDDDMCVLEG